MNPHRRADRFQDRNVPGDPRLLAAIQRRDPKISGLGGAMYHTPGGVIIEVPNARRQKAAGTSCPFGGIITYLAGETTVTGIRGGLFQCGDMNFSVPNQALDLETDGKWFIQIILDGVTPNVDDDEEIFLPGIETATGTPAWDFKVWTDGGNYDSNTNPSSPGDTGELVAPCGILTIEEGAVTFDPVACGSIVASQCAGILSHSRGGA